MCWYVRYPALWVVRGITALVGRGGSRWLRRVQPVQCTQGQHHERVCLVGMVLLQRSWQHVQSVSEVDE